MGIEIFKKHKNKVLILSPHTDDAEIGCGATISKLNNQGHDIYYVVFSSCDDSLPKGFPKGTLAREMYSASSLLGVKKENIKLLDYKVRYFSDSRQSILEELVKLNKRLSPDIVFMPSPSDIHQDHKVVCEEGMRAFKNTTILLYEMPWNNMEFKNEFFSIVTETDMHNKIIAIQKYKTQEKRQYTSPKFIESQLVFHGTKVGHNYSELFEVLRVVSL
jgi:LmbE family N-acetylglucosaminyl deacetylase